MSEELFLRDDIIEVLSKLCVVQSEARCLMFQHQCISKKEKQVEKNVCSGSSHY
jgi:hypothetical protein